MQRSIARLYFYRISKYSLYAVSSVGVIFVLLSVLLVFALEEVYVDRAELVLINYDLKDLRIDAFWKGLDHTGISMVGKLCYLHVELKSQAY